MEMRASCGTSSGSTCGRGPEWERRSEMATPHLRGSERVRLEEVPWFPFRPPRIPTNSFVWKLRAATVRNGGVCPRGHTIERNNALAKALPHRQSRRRLATHPCVRRPKAKEEQYGHAHSICAPNRGGRGSGCGGTDGRIGSQVFQPRDVLFDNGRIGAVIAASNRLHVCRLQQRHSGAALERHGFRAKPRLIFHNDDMALAVHHQR